MEKKQRTKKSYIYNSSIIKDDYLLIHCSKKLLPNMLLVLLEEIEKEDECALIWNDILAFH